MEDIDYFGAVNSAVTRVKLAKTEQKMAQSNTGLVIKQ